MGRFSPIGGLVGAMARDLGGPVVIRRLFDRFLAKGGLHPDLTLAPLETEDKPALILRQATGSRDAAAHLHPDLDWDLALAEPPDVAEPEAEMDALDLAMSLEELRHDEEAADDIPCPPVLQRDRPLDIDWNLELSWAGATGAAGDAEGADTGWQTFDFDVADLGPDPEALAEETLPALETATARDRRLDGAAANLVLSLGAFRIADRRDLHRRFRTIVEEFQHPASHAALHRLLAEGASLEEIEEAARLRCLWRDQPWLWAERRFAMSTWGIRRSPVQRLAFGWPTAIRLVRTFGLTETERAMGEDWFDAWTLLDRARAVSPVEEMAFFTYAGFLRQLTPAIVLETPEGVHEDVADGPERLDLHDSRRELVWQFERKLPSRAGELSLEPARLRNHGAFEDTAREDNFGLADLVAISPVEVIAAGFCRTYLFPEKRFDGASGTRAKVSSPACHGAARIVGLNLEACQVTLAVPHGQKRLLETNLALIAEPPPSVRKADRASDGRTKTKNKEKTQ